MGLRKLGIFSLAALVFFATCAVDLCAPKAAKADLFTFENIGKPFNLVGIDDSILPGLGNHLDLTVTVDIPPNFTGEIDETQIKSFSFSCGSYTWSDKDYKLYHPSPMTFINGKPDGFCDVGLINNEIVANSTLQMLVATGDVNNIVFGSINGGLSALAAKKDGLWYYNFAQDPPSPWVLTSSSPSNVPVPATVLLFGTALVVGALRMRFKRI